MKIISQGHEKRTIYCTFNLTKIKKKTPVKYNVRQ